MATRDEIIDIADEHEIVPTEIIRAINSGMLRKTLRRSLPK